MKILFIDEEVEIEAVVEVLRARHPEDTVELADRLKDAKRILCAKPFDVIVLDIMMPADEVAVPGSGEDSGLISGLLLLRWLRADEGNLNAKTPVVLFTGLLLSEHHEVQRASECEVFLQKPLDPDSLYQRLVDATKRQ